MLGLLRINSFAVWALSTIHLFGINSMYGLVYRNGYYNALIQLRDHGPYVLPGSNHPILTTFTGIKIIDNLLTLAGVMFANATDGTAPALSLYAFQFAGQLVPVLTVIMIEGIRYGNRRTLLQTSVLWGLLMQCLGYGFVMPIYGITHLLSSQTATKVHERLVNDIGTYNMPFLESLPISIVVGYIIPSILMCVPMRSSWLHQWLMGLWQGFPLWVTLLQTLIGFIRAQPTEATRGTNTGQQVPKCRIGEMGALHHAYLFAFSIAAATHLTTVTLLASRSLFPWLIPASVLTSLTFRNVFLPPMFTSCANMENMAAGIHNFFQYDQYVGSAAAIAWAVALHCNSRKSPMRPRHWLWLIGEIWVVSLVAGPGGALVSLMWNRDERVMSYSDLLDSKNQKV